mmetsp:Transcript_17424/g.28119  ORF Transcript_17424/g.28119 Transcript_17424/m.28119 type:complete len:323 (-) Transcript_17424:7-975(-)
MMWFFFGVLVLCTCCLQADGHWFWWFRKPKNKVTTCFKDEWPQKLVEKFNQFNKIEELSKRITESMQQINSPNIDGEPTNKKSFVKISFQQKDLKAQEECSASKHCHLFNVDRSPDTPSLPSFGNYTIVELREAWSNSKSPSEFVMEKLNCQHPSRPRKVGESCAIGCPCSGTAACKYPDESAVQHMLDFVANDTKVMRLVTGKCEPPPRVCQDYPDVAKRRGMMNFYVCHPGGKTYSMCQTLWGKLRRERTYMVDAGFACNCSGPTFHKPSKNKQCSYLTTTGPSVSHANYLVPAPFCPARKVKGTKTDKHWHFKWHFKGI